MSILDLVGVLGAALMAVGPSLSFLNLVRTSTSLGICAVGTGLCCFVAVVQGSVILAGMYGALCAVSVWGWWKNRPPGGRGRRGRRTVRALGEKGRAAVHALVRQMTPSPIPAHGSRP